MITIDISDLKRIRLGSSDDCELETLMEMGFDAVGRRRRRSVAQQVLYYISSALTAGDVLDNFGEDGIVAELRSRGYDIKEDKEDGA